MLVLVAYNFATTRKKQCTKNIVALVINNSEEAIEIHCVECVGQSLKWFALVKNDTDFVTKTDIINVFPCPILKRGVYEFLEDVNIDILWYI